MALLFSKEILRSVEEELNKAEESVQIISAYCKESTFLFLNQFIDESVRIKKLLVRMRMEDIIKGSSDLSIIEKGFEYGWEIYIRFDLHAKTYIVDNKRGLIGSANATNAGLCLDKKGNMEVATLVNMESNDIEKISRLYDDAILVDKELYNNLKRQIEEANLDNIHETYCWDKSVTDLFVPKIDVLFSYELPEEFLLEEGEFFSFLDMTFTGDKNELKQALRWSNVYIWLMSELKENDGCLYFGSLTQKLHNVLVSDPKPYRKDVKLMLANLLKLIDLLEMDDICIDRPNHSQRIRLVNN